MKLQKSHILIGLAGAVVIYLIVNGIYNYLLSEEQKIKSLFYQMASDIEEGDVLGFGSYFTKGAVVRYQDLEITCRQVGPLLWRRRQAYGDLSITFKQLAVELKGDEAIVTFIAEVVDAGSGTGRRRGGFEGTARLRKVDGEWKLYEATGREHSRPRVVW